MKGEWRRIFLSGILCLIAAVTILNLPISSLQTPYTWLEGDIELERSEPADLTIDHSTLAYWKRRDCKQQTVQVVSGPGETTSYDTCVTTGSNIRLAAVNYDTSSFAVGFPGDSKMYRVRGVSPPAELIAGTDTLLMTYRNPYNWTFAIIEDFSQYLTEDMSYGYKRFTAREADLIHAPRSHDFSQTANTQVIGYSPNGRYIVWTSSELGGFHYKIRDTQTGKVRVFDYTTDNLYALHYMDITVSNDGRHAVWSAGGGVLKIWNIEQCGYEDPIPSDRPDASKRCPSRLLNTDTVTGLGYDNRPYVAHDLAFSVDGGQLSFHRLNGSELYKYTVFAHGYAEPRLRYLALGDSFSSGEGDTGRDKDGKNYYLPGTDDEGAGDMCHISKRSYPFLLRDRWGISERWMKSVACSGAMLKADYYAEVSSYYGQDSRLASKKGIEALRDKALRDVQPGWVPQIEFIRTYRPHIVTLTGGGNDVGFADVLIYCAKPTITSVSKYDRCEYAKWGSYLNRMLLTSIDSQFAYTVELINKIKQVSPMTKVVIVGYPSFISAEADYCEINGGFLSPPERHMINQATTYMNSMLRSAAFTTHSSFVNVEQALVGGRICEGEEYVTDLLKHIVRIANTSERFHPNALGHKRLADSIYQSDIYNHDSLVDSDTHSVLWPFEKTLKAVLMKVDTVYRTAMGNLAIKAGILAPNTTYKITVHSDPVTLGTYRTREDGAASADITFKDVPPGKHVLVLEGVGIDEKSIRLYQFIEVRDGEHGADTSVTDGEAAAQASERRGYDNVDALHDSSHMAHPSNGGQSSDNTREQLPRVNSTRASVAGWSSVIVVLACIIIARSVYARRQKKSTSK